MPPCGHPSHTIKPAVFEIACVPKTCIQTRETCLNRLEGAGAELRAYQRPRDGSHPVWAPTGMCCLPFGGKCKWRNVELLNLIWWPQFLWPIQPEDPSGDGHGRPDSKPPLLQRERERERRPDPVNIIQASTSQRAERKSNGGKGVRAGKGKREKEKGGR